jgi:bla regulator protein blaR1
MTKQLIAILAAVSGLIGATIVPRLGAQAPAGSPTFEVASVKPNKSGDGRVMLGLQPGGRFTATNVTLRLLIRNAYRVQDFQIVGGPGWISSDHFDIVAKAEGDPPQDQIQLMVRALLADRFKLAVHNDKRELPIYALVLARPDGRPGPKLRPASTDCEALRARGRGAAPPPGPPPGPPGGPMSCGMRMAPGNFVAGGMPLTQLATTLSQIVGRVVQDQTGLSGQFDFELSFTPEQMPQGPPPGANAPPLPPIDPNGPSLFTALQEQLGLKLESTKGSVDVLVIDRVEPPTVD